MDEAKDSKGSTCSNLCQPSLLPLGKAGLWRGSKSTRAFFVSLGHQHITWLPQPLMQFARSYVHSFTRLSSLVGQLSAPPAQIPLQSTAAKVWVGMGLSKSNTRAVWRHEKSYIFWIWFKSIFMVTPQRCASNTRVLFFQKYFHELSL